MDAVLRDSQQIKAIQGRIGKGIALRVVRRRGLNRSIPAFVLVNRVCLQENTLSQTLNEFGWSDSGRNIVKLREALAGALDRMMGPVQRQHGYVFRDPEFPHGFEQFVEDVQNGA